MPGAVVPAKLRLDILTRIHDGHWGISRSRERAKSCVWWPGISAALKAFVEKCEHCQTQRALQVKGPLLPTPLLARAWQGVGADLLDFKSKKYLVVSDYYSRCIELFQLTSESGSAVIGQFKSICARWGIPEVPVTDNQPVSRLRNSVNSKRTMVLTRRWSVRDSRKLMVPRCVLQRQLRAF